MIEYIEKEGDEYWRSTVGLKWTIGQAAYGAWKLKENDEDDFHFLVSAAYWWSMYRRNWMVQLWVDFYSWLRRRR